MQVLIGCTLMVLSIGFRILFTLERIAKALEERDQP
jgi:hypothetical protein